MDLLFGFSGRIGRGKWWLAEFAIIPVWALVFAVFAGFVSVADPSADHEPGSLSNGGLTLGIAIAAALILSIWINAAATVKRFHDRDKSGLWFFIIFVPFIGPIWQIVECGLLPGDPSVNRFGPPPGGGFGSFADEVDAHVARMKAENAPKSQMEPAAALAPVVTQRHRAPSGGSFGRRGR